MVARLSGVRSRRRTATADPNGRQVQTSQQRLERARLIELVVSGVEHQHGPSVPGAALLVQTLLKVSDQRRDPRLVHGPLRGQTLVSARAAVGVQRRPRGLVPKLLGRRGVGAAEARAPSADPPAGPKRQIRRPTPGR